MKTMVFSCNRNKMKLSLNYFDSIIIYDNLPNADATTAKALAVVFRTYSSILSISGLMVEIMVANPAALARFEMISRPSTRA